jgi:hypothetical protein
VKGVGEVKSLSGVSVNLNERTFVGAVGWESESVSILGNLGGILAN